MRTIQVLVVMATAVSTGGCGPSLNVSTMRAGGMHPAKPANCPLELHTEAMDGQMMTAYEPVGFVVVSGANDGEPPNAPRLLELIKPQACTLGGDIVTIGMSANMTYPGTMHGDDSQHTYMVLRKKVVGESTTQKF